METFTHHAYTLLAKEEISDIQATGLLFRHNKSGARICVLSNDDENKVFYAGFRTPPADSTGVAHIIEHSVLCGSRKFPLKDPFIELVKGSMNTFLNAITFPDKTLYPVASCNDKDFSNLMDVYMDSVFYPNIYQNPCIFQQEGWHYELNDESDPLTLNGVVYNEMKGAFSSSESMVEREIFRSLYPDTAYANESGGDPAHIPELTYEAFLDFHRTYYHPSNSYLYLYGNMDVEERLDWLDREYLHDFSQIEIDSAIKYQTPFAESKDVTISYPVASNASLSHASWLAAAWSVGSNLDREQYIAFELLDYALLTAQGAPLKQALLDAGIGNDIFGGYDNGTLQPMFTLIAKNTDAEKKDAFLSIIRDVLQKQVEQGINKKALLAALNSSEFRYRESDYGNIPKGLMYGIQLMDSWLYDETKPFLHLHLLEVYEQLRGKIETDYFEKLLQKWLLDNKHSIILTANPDPELLRNREANLKTALAKKKDSMSAEEIRGLISQTEALHAFGKTPCTPEQLATIPHLTRADLKREAEPFSNRLSEDGPVPVLFHEYETNGILYLDLQFRIDSVPEEDLPVLGVLRRLLGKLDTADYSYADLTDEVYLYTGGIRSDISVYAKCHDKDSCIPRFETRMKVLAENRTKAVHLTKSILCKTDFSDEKRIYELLSESRSRLKTELSEAGHSTSVRRALSCRSRVSRYGDLTSGIGYFRYLEDIVDHFEEKKDALLTKLKDLYAQIFVKKRLFASATCKQELAPMIQEMMGGICSSLPEGSLPDPVPVLPAGTRNEGFMDASQVQYVSLAGRFDIDQTPYTPVFRIYRSIMSYEYLWTNIRVEGGAYGCMAEVSRNGDVYFTSYRDPKLTESLEIYRKVPAYLRSFTADEQVMTKYVIGTFSDLDTPLSPADKGRRSLSAYIGGLTLDEVQADRDRILQAGAGDIRALADPVEEALKDACVCVLGNEEKLKQEAALFDQLTHLSEA